MKIIHLSNTAIGGGAARAAYRIHRALLASSIESQMYVSAAIADDLTVKGPRGRFVRALTRLRPQLASPVRMLLSTGNPIIHSPAVVPSNWHRYLNSSDADVVHLHWVQSEMLSISDIGRIKKPIVWTLHDMWPFCGAEHYTADFRWRDGYQADNRPDYEGKFDLNRWVWQRKKRHWLNPMHIVAPSDWLGDCVRESELMRKWPITVIPYPIELDAWSPVSQKLARDLLGLPIHKSFLLFGAIGGCSDPRKGFDLLASAITHLSEEINDLELIIFGQTAPDKTNQFGLPVHYFGHLNDQLSLKVLYSAADVFALPSRMDNLPLTCMESLACGTPVVAYNSSGPPSMIKHKQNGYLAKPYQPNDFAEGLRFFLCNSDKAHARKFARDFCQKQFAPSLISRKYLEVYNKAIEESRK